MSASHSEMDETTLVLADGQFKLTPTGLIANGQPDFETWQVVGEQLRYMEGAIHWWIGDWLNYGQQRWGEAFAQALDYSDGTMANDKYIAGAIPVSRRRENLTFSHHREVASLPPQKQDKILTRAEKEELTTRQVREIAKAERGNKPDYRQSVEAIIRSIDALAEVYPLGIETIRQHLETL